MMPSPLPKCLRCGGEMQPGYIADRTVAGYDPAKWFEGDLVTGVFGGVEKARSKPLLVSTYRCIQCGYLKSYAESHASGGQAAK
ncbi:MAG: hypothetical protein ABSG53_14650 [Thermoguttaceae bacterium]